MWVCVYVYIGIKVCPVVCDTVRVRGPMQGTASGRDLLRVPGSVCRCGFGGLRWVLACLSVWQICV